MSEFLLRWTEDGEERTLNVHRLKSIGMNRHVLEMVLRYVEPWEEAKISLTGKQGVDVFKQYSDMNHDEKTCRQCVDEADGDDEDGDTFA